MFNNLHLYKKRIMFNFCKDIYCKEVNELFYFTCPKLLTENFAIRQKTWNVILHKVAG